MPKRGDTRSDGKFFVHANKKGEYWADLQQFLKVCGQDWFERRKRMDENVRQRAILKAAAEKRRGQRELFEAAHPKPQKRVRRVFASPEEKAAHERERQRIRNQRKRDKIAPEIEARKAERERLKRERESAKLMRATDREAKRLAKISKPKRARKVLSPQERKEARRADKRNYKHRRRALLKGHESKATGKQLREAKRKAKGTCFYCRSKFRSLTIDHIVPLANGGSHTMDNIVFACHGCNSEKRDLSPIDYGRKHGLLLV